MIDTCDVLSLIHRMFSRALPSASDIEQKVVSGSRYSKYLLIVD